MRQTNAIPARKSAASGCRVLQCNIQPSPQKRSKEGGRALSVEAPLGMSMEMLTFDTNLGGYRTDITEQQIRGAPAFSRDQTSTNVEAFA